MINQDTGRALSIGIWRLEEFSLQIGLNRQICRQQDRNHGPGVGDSPDGQSAETSTGMDSKSLASYRSATWLVRRRSCLLQPSRHVAVNHSIVVVLRSGMEVKRRQTEEEQKQ